MLRCMERPRRPLYVFSRPIEWSGEAEPEPETNLLLHIVQRELAALAPPVEQRDTSNGNTISRDDDERPGIKSTRPQRQQKGRASRGRQAKARAQANHSHK